MRNAHSCPDVHSFAQSHLIILSDRSLDRPKHFHPCLEFVLFMGLLNHDRYEVSLKKNGSLLISLIRYIQDSTERLGNRVSTNMCSYEFPNE